MPEQPPNREATQPWRVRIRRAARLCGLSDTELAAALDGERGREAPDESRLRGLLACPTCRGELEWGDRIRCVDCDALYDVTDGIPILLPPAASTADAHKTQQATFTDEAEPEFEITRPHGTAPFYRWLLEQKFRRSLDALPSRTGSVTALTICGGSGMDAEFLARAGASVISTDLSLGAARRTRERALRFGLDILPVVADAENLPFRDRSLDLVYVHDGLHHLESPEAGLREMLRTSRWAVSINEPARAGATMLATRIRLAEHVEEAGNFIARVDPAALVAHVAAAGFSVVKLERYAMVYRHKPGRLAALLSQPGLLGLTRAALGAFNAVAGATGNKLTLQAVRPRGPSD